MQLKLAAEALEVYAEYHGTTEDRAIEQEDGSVLILRSVHGEKCEAAHIPAAERERWGWSKPDSDPIAA